MKPSARIGVFVVDDSRIIRERLLALLAELPKVQVVGQAELAPEAIEAIRKLKPAAVILDISMPGGSGLQVLETIRREAIDARVIMLTNLAHEPYRSRCLQLGADYFFDKSTEFEKVIEVLRALSGRPAARGRKPVLPI